MSGSHISILDVARESGKRKQSIFKILKRLNIEPTKIRSTESRGQRISYITEDEYRRVRDEISAIPSVRQRGKNERDSASDYQLSDLGVFYLLELEPEHDPGRFKVGFAQSLPERMRTLRCSAPLLKVVASWPCKQLWEKVAIECVTQDCERLHTEVFRTLDIEAVVERCKRFFDQMPKVPSRTR